ncbi:MAG: PKD domain-containing protein [Bacteroidia bacterium]
MGLGQQIATGTLTRSDSFIARGESLEPITFVGPVHPDSVGPTAYFGSPLKEFVYFTVFKPVRINSIWVNAQTRGLRDIEVWDPSLRFIKKASVYLKAGPQRVPLGLELQPGDYQIGGRNMGLLSNTDSANYPYESPGLLYIYGNSGPSNNFRYYYNWEIQPIPCQSPEVRIPVTVLNKLEPYYDAYPWGMDVYFHAYGIREITGYYWDFGDGTTDSVSDPVHTFDSVGIYMVTLTISNGSCDSSFTSEVYIDGSMPWNIDPPQAISFHLFPNPGQGRLRVTAEPATISRFQLSVYDVHGKQIYLSKVVHAETYNTDLDLSAQAEGLYFIRLQVDDRLLSGKYVLKH